MASCLFYHQAWDRDHPVNTKNTDWRGVLTKMSSKVFDDLGGKIKQTMENHGVHKDEEWKLTLAVNLVQLGIPAPWPATLCRLATSTDLAESTGELSESLRTNKKTCDAIIAIVQEALKRQLDAEAFGVPVGLTGLSKDAHVLVSVTSQVGDKTMYNQVWRKAQAENVRTDGLIAKDSTAERTVTVDAPKDGKPPTITLGAWSMQPGAAKGYTYAVKWLTTSTPTPGEYVISGLADGGEHGQVQLTEKGGSDVMGSFINPTEAYLTVAMREGSGTREYSAAAIARHLVDKTQGPPLSLSRQTPFSPAGDSQGSGRLTDPRAPP